MIFDVLRLGGLCFLWVGGSKDLGLTNLEAMSPYAAGIGASWRARIHRRHGTHLHSLAAHRDRIRQRLARYKGGIKLSRAEVSMVASGLNHRSVAAPKARAKIASVASRMARRKPAVPPAKRVVSRKARLSMCIVRFAVFISICFQGVFCMLAGRGACS